MEDAPRNAGLWTDHLVPACRSHPELAAVFESPSGEVALLLHHTLVPLKEEGTTWLAQTRASVRQIVLHLRASGLRGKVTVVQWCSLREADEILTAWTCRYDGDAARRAQLASVARRYVLDEKFLTACTTRRSTGSTPRVERVADILVGPLPPPFVGSGHVVEDWRHLLARWYRAMAPCWRSVAPCLRRELVLTTHVWLATRVIRGAEAALPAVACADLTECGPLGRAMVLCIPAHQHDDWGPWVRLVLADLSQALRRPAVARDESWGRWLFLIPYAIPTPRPRRPTACVAPDTGRIAGAGVAA